MPHSAIPRRNERVAARVVEGKALIVVIDRKQLHRLSEVGTFVWEACDGRSVDAIADLLVDEFDVDKATALADVQHFVDELAKFGAIELGGDA